MSAPSLGLTSYAEQVAAYAGMLYDLRDNVVVAARNNQSSGTPTATPNEIPFGTVVIRDNDAATPASPVVNVVRPAAGGFRAFGVVVHAHVEENGPNGLLGTLGLKPDAVMSVLRRGAIYVNTEDACTEGNAAFVRHTVNGALLPGALRSDADTAKADEVTGIIWRTTRADAGLAIVEVDMIAYDAIKNI